MGLTINYKITAKNEEQALEGLEKIRQKCLDLPFEKVGEVEQKEITKKIQVYWNFLQKQCSYPNNSKENLEKRNRLIEETGLSAWDMIKSDDRIGKMFSLNIWAGEGCEPCDIQFFIDKKKYKASGFCKTQYSVHFVRHHLLVCSMLDIAKEVGFKVEVEDEGEYFETRDINVLAKNLKDYNGMVLEIKEELINCGWDKGQIESSIDKNQSIIIIKNKK